MAISSPPSSSPAASVHRQRNKNKNIVHLLSFTHFFGVSVFTEDSFASAAAAALCSHAKWLLFFFCFVKVRVSSISNCFFVCVCAWVCCCCCYFWFYSVYLSVCWFYRVSSLQISPSVYPQSNAIQIIQLITSHYAHRFNLKIEI